MSVRLMTVDNVGGSDGRYAADEVEPGSRVCWGAVASGDSLRANAGVAPAHPFTNPPR